MENTTDLSFLLPDCPAGMTEGGGVTVTSFAPEDTERLGASLARLMEAHPELPPYIALYGDLGVGKTAFVRGVASVLAPGCAVRSPTFALVNEYRTTGKKPLYHFDMYRIDSEDDLYSIGYDEYPDQGICVVEWCEKIPYALPERFICVRIEKCPPDPDKRMIRIHCEEGYVC